jgi:phosphopyruvate hydratase
MSSIIKNYDSLATSAIRRDALEIVEAGLQAIDTVTVLNDSVVVDSDTLIIQGQHFNLLEYEHIYIIGFGKVSCTAAYTLEKILEGRVKDGAVIGMSERTCQVVETYAGTHPLPSQQNYIATKHIAEVARCAKENDLVLVVVSGGGSALLCSSMGECNQGNTLFNSFLQSGGTIEELNIVRKHISQLKGGGLAKALFPATVVGLVFSDVPGGDMASVASGPTYFDTSTIQDAESLITKYDLGEFQLQETPKDPKYFEKVHNFTIVSNVTALNAMQKAAQEKSYRANLVSATQYADVQETKTLLMAKTEAGAMLCMGGETKVTVPKDCSGTGGRNSYLALSMLETVQENQVFISIASDGHDNSSAAGAIVDFQSKQKALQSNLAIDEYLTAFDSFPFFEQLDGHIKTDMLESNVSDLMLLLTAQTDADQAAITDVSAVAINDSRGKSTIEVTVCAGEWSGTFGVPSGASTGDHEVAVLPAQQAVKIIEKVIKPALVGVSVSDQEAIDQLLHELDGTEKLSVIGGNTALGVSIAACKAAAAAKGIEVWQHVAELFHYKEQTVAPRLFVNLINGGKHAVHGSNIQEHQIIPDTDDVRAAFDAAKEIQRSLRNVLLETYKPSQISIGDEGGFVVPSDTIMEPFEYITQAIKQADVQVPILLGSDIAASSFCNKDVYTLGGQSYDSASLLQVYSALHKKFPLLQMVEDPYEEHDFESFAAYKNAHPSVLTIGDDLTTTNKKQLQRAIEEDSINAIIIKPNQIGTLSDTLETMSLAYENKIWCIVSHRSGETMDDFIADLAQGTKCFGLKAGAPDKEERKTKYDRLLKIQSK